MSTLRSTPPPLPPDGDWRREMELRVAAYRQRRFPELNPAASLERAPAPSLRRVPLSAWNEPLADPVLPAPAPVVAAGPAVWTAVRPPAPPPLLRPSAIPAPAAPDDTRLGEPVAAVAPVSVRRLPPALPLQPALTIPLPAGRVARPERPPLPVAPVALRLRAAIDDATAIALAAASFALAAWAATGFSPPEPGLLRHLLPAFGVVPLALAIVYRLLCQFSGATLGMRRRRLRLVRFDGEPVTRADHWRRAAAGLLALLPFGLGFWWMLCDSEQLGAQDHISQTVLTHLPVGCKQ